MTTMNSIGLDVHKKTISYCVKDVSGRIQQEGKVASTRRELDGWMKTLPQPWTVAMEAAIFSGWTYDHLLPHAAQIKVAHPLMLRAIAADKKRTQTQSSVTALQGPRLQMDVWFCRAQEPMPRGTLLRLEHPETVDLHALPSVPETPVPSLDR